ncbi:MAG: CIA30 family protein [Phenylobacterium sp.]|uniref:amidohydrolase family protein n=1 Tax=Phenylobacterium sp. TaxID=1871053 RepID=UPI0025CEB261|nr:amidohydrolase family protein [Phenylobacterium sp.]MCG9916194.1 CIA30 family protein [Phenylobacterium sp.]
MTFKPLSRILVAAAMISALSAGGGATQQPGSAVAIVGATVFDATGSAPRVADVLIQDGRIAAVGTRLSIPAGATVIDGTGKALTPGFFDVHTHWTPNGTPFQTPAIATAYVQAGVTTVNDFHQPPESYAPRREWLAQLASPHVNLTARMSTPGGHGADWGDTNTTKWVNTPAAARLEVSRLVPYAPDLIKAFADGWRYGLSPDNTSMNLDTLSALVDEAHKNNLKVVTHTVTVARGKIAAQAKVDIIVHSLQDTHVDQEVIDLLKAAGTAYAPTLAVYEPVKPGQSPPEDLNNPRFLQSNAKFQYALRNVKALYDGGVLVALGTDAGMPGTPHGVATWREMELLVQAGLTPVETLMVATANSARAMGVLEDRGTIEVGKRADLVLIDGTPWANISDVRKTERVFIDGRQVVGPGVALPEANSLMTMAPAKAQVLIDDFEGAPGRTASGALRVQDTDGGMDRSVLISLVAPEAGGDNALRLAARMSVKDDPHTGVILPLSRGSIQPVDASAFQGLSFALRGDGGAYRVMIRTVGGWWQAEVKAGAKWTNFTVPFKDLAPSPGWRRAQTPWTGADLLEVQFGGGRPAGDNLWLEVDDVRFY